MEEDNLTVVLNDVLHKLVDTIKTRILHHFSNFLLSIQIHPQRQPLDHWIISRFQAKVHILNVIHACRSLIQLASDITVMQTIYDVSERRARSETQELLYAKFFQRILAKYFVDRPPLPDPQPPTPITPPAESPRPAGQDKPAAPDYTFSPPNETAIAIGTLLHPTSLAMIDRISTPILRFSIVESSRFFEPAAPRAPRVGDPLTTRDKRLSIAGAPALLATAEDAEAWLRHPPSPAAVIKAGRGHENYHSRLMLHP